MPSEAGFILVHVSMVAYSKYQARAVYDALRHAQDGSIDKLASALQAHLNAMKLINGEMETMWTRSDPNDYKIFRTFIMGIKSQPMFPEGVLYEGVCNERKNYRGESGANDSIIPTADNLFQIFERMPENPLTEILKDFRSYRPPMHTEWLSYVQDTAQRIGFRQLALRNVRTAVLMLENLDQIREFRQRHWNFTKEYILKHSNHPVATGGSPIVTWLPNQLSTVLRIMDETLEAIEMMKEDPEMDDHHRQRIDAVKKRMVSQENNLEREVQLYSAKVSGRSGTA